MRRLFGVALFSTALILAARVAAQNSGSNGATFSLTISLPKPSVSLGSKVPLGKSGTG
jgi:hypothetical protein